MQGIRRTKIYVYLLIFAVTLLIPCYAEAARGIAVRPVSPTGDKVTGDQWLLVIGIDTYINWSRLKTAVNDAKSVRDVLLSRYYFDKNHVIELYDEEATRKNILGKLRFLAQKVGRDDSLVIFYAGHGHIDSITKAGSWVPVESGIKDASAWISNHDIKNYLRVDAIKAKHILLISDSCFSGDFFRGHRGKLPEVTDEVIKRAYKLTSRQALTSGGLEPVSDEGFGRNSVFSHFLVKTLRENQKPFLVPSDLFPDVKAGVAENAEQFPRFGSLKDAGGQQGGELVFFLKQESRLKTLSAESLARKKELERLRQMEAADEAARKKEAAEIAKRERELAKLDQKIEQLRARLGTTAVESDDGLDAIFAMVSQKEQQQQRLEELKKKREEEEARRRAEIERLKSEKRAKLVAQAKEDIRKYQKIASSPYGADMKEAAWKSLAAKYPEAAKGLGPGDEKTVLYRLRWGALKRTVTNSIGMEFVLISPGTFLMGSAPDESGRDDDETVHQVTISTPYYMQATEVTQAQWKAVMGNNPSKFKGDDRPVEQVSWNDCQEFIRRLNKKEGSKKYRLPTEAEWEYACRAGSGTRFCFGDSDGQLGEYAWYDSNSSKIHSVAQKKPNAWGLYDMHGNVWEWCEDSCEWKSKVVTDTYHDDIADPLCRKGSHRVSRGGSWFNFAWFCRSANRHYFSPGSRGNYLGFRLARTP